VTKDKTLNLAHDKLVGKTITEVRYLTEEENEALELGFTKLPLMIWFSNYSYVFASPTDTDEGAAGTLLGGSLKTHLTWSFPPFDTANRR